MSFDVIVLGGGTLAAYSAAYSAAYFALASSRDVARILALGDRMLFVHEGS